MSIFDKIMDKMEAIKEGAEKRRALREIEKQAYDRQKQLDADAKWQEAVQKAEARGIRNAQLTKAEQIKADLQERQDKARSRRISNSSLPVSQSIKGAVGASYRKKNFGSAVVGSSQTNKKPLLLKK